MERFEPKRKFEGFEEITYRLGRINLSQIYFEDYSSMISMKITTEEDEKKFKKLNQMTRELIKNNNITFKY